MPGYWKKRLSRWGSDGFVGEDDDIGEVDVNKD